MDYFAGLDVSVKETSVCIVDDTGKIVREARVASEPEALLQVLTNTLYRFKRVGLEAGPLSQWLYSVLAEAGLPVICVETRHMRAMLKAQINKTDRNDARGIAQMMRVGLYRPALDLGGGRAGQDSVDGDTVTAELARHRLGHTDERGLGRDVVEVVWPPEITAPEAMLMMRPHCARRIAGSTARQHRNGPVTLTLSTVSYSSSGICSNGRMSSVEKIAALLMRISIRR
jgi:hypothetical protein